jgi:hypothetical protein
MILETEPNLIVDCSDFLDSFLFEDLHSNLEDEIMNKYELNEEHFNQNGGSLDCSLKRYLNFQNKYLDLL